MLSGTARGTASLMNAATRAGDGAQGSGGEERAGVMSQFQGRGNMAKQKGWAELQPKCILICDEGMSRLEMVKIGAREVNNGRVGCRGRRGHSCSMSGTLAPDMTVF
jgi:hypothetical protein